LPAPRLEESASCILRLRESTGKEHAAILRETAGAWSGLEGEAIENAIEEGCERMDPRDR
jgi:hypothetical protein